MGNVYGKFRKILKNEYVPSMYLWNEKCKMSVLESLEKILKESKFEYIINVALKWEM